MLPLLYVSPNSKECQLALDQALQLCRRLIGYPNRSKKDGGSSSGVDLPGNRGRHQAIGTAPAAREGATAPGPR